MPCALANERTSAWWHFPVHSIICRSRAEQRGCSGRSRSQSSKTLSSSLSWTKTSVDVVAACSSTSIPSQCSAAPVSARSSLSGCGAPVSSCSPSPCVPRGTQVDPGTAQVPQGTLEYLGLLHCTLGVPQGYPRVTQGTLRCQVSPGSPGAPGPRSVGIPMPPGAIVIAIVIAIGI